MSTVSFARTLYSMLLHAYPARLREEFGAEMLQLFDDQLSGARVRGACARFYFHMLSDLFRTAPAARLSQLSAWAAEREAAPVHRVLRRGLLFAPNGSAAILITAFIFAFRGLRALHRAGSR